MLHGDFAGLLVAVGDLDRVNALVQKLLSLHRTTAGTKPSPAWLRPGPPRQWFRRPLRRLEIGTARPSAWPLGAPLACSS